ncbi:MAG TPA: hypothetical protein VGS61_02615 [Acidimicrobiales bacterium]|nr:hypothetical protein [Acidimicrobiales bacterium]
MTTVVAGSLAVLASSLEGVDSSDVVGVPTAAAFTGAPAAAMAVAGALEGVAGSVEALMVTDRASASEPYFASRVAAATLVVLADGSPLHARSVWRDTPVGDALRGSGALVAVGGVATALFDVMVDPRGGAPTIGLGWRSGLVVTVPGPADGLARTRALLGPDVDLVVVGPTGVVRGDGGRWEWAGDVVPGVGGGDAG